VTPHAYAAVSAVSTPATAHDGTNGSNPLCSCGESTNSRSLSAAGGPSGPRLARRLAKPNRQARCQRAATARGRADARLAAREADLLPVGYFHLVFTLPAEIASIANQNKSVVYDLLFRTSSETLLTIAADLKHLGARIGITAVLHTWGSAMTQNPHS